MKPAEIRKLNNAELRKEYSRMRSIANKRIDRLNAAGLRTPTARGKFPKIAGLTNGEIERELADVSNFLRNARTTVRGERKFINSEIRILRERGYNFIDESNIYDFIEFMEKKRQELGDKVYDSGKAADVYDAGQRLKIPTKVLEKNFDYFAENIEKMETVNPIKTLKTITFSAIKRKIERL